MENLPILCVNVVVNVGVLLKSNLDFIILNCDKNLGPAIMERSEYIQETKYNPNNKMPQKEIKEIKKRVSFLYKKKVLLNKDKLSLRAKLLTIMELKYRQKKKNKREAGGL